MPAVADDRAAGNGSRDTPSDPSPATYVLRSAVARVGVVDGSCSGFADRSTECGGLNQLLLIHKEPSDAGELPRSGGSAPGPATGSSSGSSDSD